MLPHSLIVDHHCTTLDATHRTCVKSLEVVAGLSEVLLKGGRDTLELCASNGTLRVEQLADLKPRQAFGSFDPQLQAYRQSLHVITRGYADLVDIAEDYWHKFQGHLQSGLGDLEKHAPGGTEPAFDAMISTSKVIDDVTERMAETSIDLVTQTDENVNGRGTTTRKSARATARG